MLFLSHYKCYFRHNSYANCESLGVCKVILHPRPYNANHTVHVTTHSATRIINPDQTLYAVSQGYKAKIFYMY